jgi:hypothetical protein
MLRHAREGPARCRTRETASIFPLRLQLPLIHRLQEQRRPATAGLLRYLSR